MNPQTAVLIIAVYFSVLIILSRLTAGKTNKDFFIGGKKSKWFLVSFGMISATLSGVTFISVPGWILTSEFSYIQMVLGYVAGYLFIVMVLLPLYYKYNLTSIYTYFENRFGPASYKTGAFLFIFSRIIGASFRLFLVAGVLQIMIFDHVKVPFEITVVVTILLIWLYTFRGGIKTIIFTDALQTLLMLTSAGFTIFFVMKSLDLNLISAIETISQSDKSRVFFFDDFFGNKYHFIKQFLGGAFITVTMTGMDQDMMQKNLSCPTLKESQKNVLVYSFSFIPVNILFLSLGLLLYIFAQRVGLSVPADSDELFPAIVNSGKFPPLVPILFLLGLVAAAYSSADSALTSLTTSFSIDILNGNKMSEEKLTRTRKRVHILISAILAVVIIVFSKIKDRSVIDSLFTIAGYTYGPLLGMFSFGMFMKKTLKPDRYIPAIAVFSPFASWLISLWVKNSYGYIFGFELLVLNGAITFILMWILSFKSVSNN